jgi:ribosomal protein S18 acetylase RimI-like enzyme
LDLPAVMAVAERVHPDLPEDLAVFAERLALYPQGCQVLADESGIGGYVVSHPWDEGDPPALNRWLGELPAPASLYYLHDLAILPERRCGGYGTAALSRLLGHAAARGFGSVRLVAVGGSASYWTRHGFAALATVLSPVKIASYGAGARMMARPVSGDGRKP